MRSPEGSVGDALTGGCSGAGTRPGTLWCVPIRAAGPADAPVLADLNGVVQQVHHDALPGQFKAPDAAAVRGFFDGCLGRAETVAFVAEDDRSTRPVGYVLAEEVRRPETPLKLAIAAMAVHHIVVVPAETRHGWGAALMRAVEDEAARRQLDEIRLDFWSFNDRAERFFAALGLRAIQRPRLEGSERGVTPVATQRVGLRRGESRPPPGSAMRTL